MATLMIASALVFGVATGAGAQSESPTPAPAPSTQPLPEAPAPTPTVQQLVLPPIPLTPTPSDEVLGQITPREAEESEALALTGYKTVTIAVVGSGLVLGGAVILGRRRIVENT